MIGISVYLSDFDENYLREAVKYGAKYVFTSLHIPEENLGNIDTVLPRLLELAEELNLLIIPDISPYTFEKLGLENRDFLGLKNLGFELVRLDFGFEDIETVKEISNHFKLVMNASLVDEKYLKSMIEVEIDLNDIYLIHNFYPRSETGLEEGYFEKINRAHLKYNLSSMAFVVGDAKKRLPLFEGLPTLEKHRDMNPYVASVELNIVYGIKLVFIGDNQAKLSTLKFMNSYFKDQVITLPAFLEPEYEYLYGSQIGIRKDEAKSIIRLAIPRKKELVCRNNNQRPKGSIVIDNELAGRYSGEVQIIKFDMPFSSRSNNIGWIHPDFIDLLKYVNHEHEIKFVRIEEVY